MTQSHSAHDETQDSQPARREPSQQQTQIAVERFGKVEDLYYKEDEDGTWELYGENKKKITGVPIHEIGLHLEGGINLAEQRNEEGEIQKVYMTFGKYKNKPVASIPPYYRKWLLDNITWNPYNQKIKEEIIRLETIKK